MPDAHLAPVLPDRAEGVDVRFPEGFLSATQPERAWACLWRDAAGGWPHPGNFHAFGVSETLGGRTRDRAPTRVAGSLRLVRPRSFAGAATARSPRQAQATTLPARCGEPAESLRARPDARKPSPPQRCCVPTASVGRLGLRLHGSPWPVKPRCGLKPDRAARWALPPMAVARGVRRLKERHSDVTACT